MPPYSRIFTDKENAGAHCNVGNTKLILDTMMSRIEDVKNRATEAKIWQKQI
jgi:hypothetical protein